MRLNQIRDLVTIVESGSMRSAARTLQKTPPVLTRSVRELEDELGVQLLERTAHGVIPTPAGKAFLARAHIIQSEMGRIMQETTQYASGAGIIKVGAATPCHHLLPGALKTFRRQYPAIELRLVGGTFPTLLPQLRDGRLELALSGVPARMAADHIKTVSLSRDEYLVIGRRGHPLREARSLAQLVDADWLVYSGPDVSEGMPGPVHTLFDVNNLPAPRSITRCSDGGAYNSLLTETDLISLCTHWRLSHGPAHNFLQAFDVEMRKPPSFCLSLGAFYRADSPLTKPVAALLAAFKGEARKFAADFGRQWNPVPTVPGRDLAQSARLSSESLVK